MRRVLGSLCVLLVVSATVAGVEPDRASAATSVPFAPRFQRNDNAAVAIIGTNQESCPTAVSTCASARAGTQKLNNDSFAMVVVDRDSDPSTVNSSNADLVLPAGGGALWALFGRRRASGGR